MDIYKTKYRQGCVNGLVYIYILPSSVFREGLEAMTPQTSNDQNQTFALWNSSKGVGDRQYNNKYRKYQGW